MTISLTDAEFVEQLTSNQVRMRAYAVSLMPFGSDADDILQKACLTIWEKREKYDAQRAFFPWACGIVLIEVLRLRRKKAKEMLVFDEVLVNTLATDFLANARSNDNRSGHLEDCLKKLSEKDRTLVLERYRSNIMPKDMAKKQGVALTTVYSALARIRESLRRCIETKTIHESRI